MTQRAPLPRQRGLRIGGSCALAIITATTSLLASSDLIDLGEIPNRPLAAERVRLEDGLAHNAVHAIAQDRFGLLWLGTEGGLQRFDGVRFDTFTAAHDSPLQLSSERIHALALDDEDHLWVATAVGVDRIDSLRRNVTSVGGSTNEALSATSMSFSAETGLLIATWRNGLLRATDESGELRFVPWGPTALQEGVVGHQVVGESIYLFRYTEEDEVEWVHRLDRDGALEATWQAGARIVTVAADESGRAELPLHSDLTTVSRHIAVSPLASEVHSVYRDRDSLWIGSMFGLFEWDPLTQRLERRSLNGDTVPAEPSADEARLDEQILAVSRDRAGTLWVGTYGGLFRVPSGSLPFQPLQEQPGSQFELPVSSVSQGGRTLWAGTYGFGLYAFDLSTRTLHERVSPSERTNGACSDYVWSVLVDRSDVVFGETGHGICVLRADGSIETLSETGTARTLRRSPRGTIWAGTVTGVWELGDATPKRWLEEPSGAIAWLGDEMWVAPTVVFRFNTLSLRRWRPEQSVAREVALPEGLAVFDLDAAFGRIWLATGSGLYALDPETERLEPVPTGERSTVVYSVGHDEDESLWLGTDDGILRLRRNGDGRWDASQYGRPDGVGSVEFNRRALTTLSGESRGLALGGMTGVTVFDPTRIPHQREPPEVVLLSATLDSTSGRQVLHHPEGLSLDRHDQGLSFRFATPLTPEANRARFSYRLVGVDAEWTQTTNHESSRYSALPPGRHQLEVRSALPDGPWSDPPLRLGVRVHPPFWSTWWFRLAVALAIAAGLTLVYRLRIARLLELQRMRLRIAADLHDELGSELSGIAFAASALGTDQDLAGAQRQRLQEISHSSRNVMEGLRDIVWYVSPEHDALSSLAERMRSTVGRLAPQFRCTLEAPAEVDFELGIDQRRSIHLAFKEALTNAVRHSGGDELMIRIRTSEQEVAVELEDNGVGMDAQTQGSVRDGLGLRSVERRMAHIGGRAIWSHGTGGVGTRVTLAFPLRQR